MDVERLRKAPMILIEVVYNFEVPESGFVCPFCGALQTRLGGRIIDNQLFPSPKQVVHDHLLGRDACAKFDQGANKFEELQITGTKLTP